jgi:hypothetical protein
MNKKFKVAWTVALFAFVFAIMTVQSLPSQATALCCVAGEYHGVRIYKYKPNCPRIVSEGFILVIKQPKPCSTYVSGTIKENSSGAIHNWIGKISTGRNNCCTFEGSFHDSSGHMIKFVGKIFFLNGYWSAKGTWDEIGSTDPCRGSGYWMISPPNYSFPD